MKIRVIDRLLMGAAGLICTVISGGVIVDCLSGFTYTQRLAGKLGQLGQGTALIIAAVMVLVLLIGIAAFVHACMRRKELAFVKQHSENGDMEIAVTAIDELVRKCVATHDEMALNATSLENSKEGLTIGLRLSLGSGVSIPLAVAALQKQMKQYITASTGLDVKDVRVQIDTAEAKDITPSAFVMPDMLGKTPTEEHAEVPSHIMASGSREEADMPLHQRLYCAEEVPVNMPEPPAEERPEQTADAEDAETVKLPELQAAAEPEASEDDAEPDDSELEALEQAVPVDGDEKALEQVAPMEEVDL